MSEPGSQTEIPVIGRDKLLRRVGGDLRLLRELVDIFLGALPEHLQRLREALAEEDIESLYKGAHYLKGSAGLFAAGPAVEAASQLDDLARSGVYDGLKAAVDVLEQELGRLEPALREILEAS